MTATKFQTDQMVQETALGVLRKPARTPQGALNSAFDQNFGSPLRLFASDPASAVLNIAAYEIQKADGTGSSIPPISSQILAFPLSTINFQTGGTTGGTIDITLPTSTIGYFRRVGFTLVNGNTLKAVFSGEAATLGAVANPGTLFIAGGITVGWVDLVATAATAFKTAGSSTSVIENSVSSVSTIHVIAAGGGPGSGEGSSGSKSPVVGYQWLEEDTFAVLTTSADSRVTLANYTNAVQNLGKSLYRLSCDKSKTVLTSSGTSLTINSSPGFTVQVGDIVYVTSGARSGQWRRISAVGSQTSYTLDSAFTGGNASASDTLMISQAVWTVDLVNAGSASEKTRARDQFSGNITQIAIDYFDSLVIDDDTPDYVDAARIVVSASNDGLVSASGVPISSTFTPEFVRQAYPAQIEDYVLNTSANYERLFLVFFCSPSNGSVTSGANLLGYEASFEVEDFVTNGGTLDSAYCYTNGAGTPINCTVLPVVAGKSRIQLNWSYIPTINAGNTEGQVRVYENGQLVPRHVAGSTTDAYWSEIADPSTGVWNIIELHDDFSTKNISIEIVRSEGIVDTAIPNTTRITNLERPTSQSMIYLGPQTAVATTHQTFAVAVPSFTMLVQPGRYRFNIRVMGAVSISAGNEVSITCALSSSSASPGANLISQEYAVNGAVFNGFQTTPSNPGYHILTEEITLVAPTNIYFAQKHFVTSGVPGPISLGIRGDLLAGAAPTTVIEAMRIGDV